MKAFTETLSLSPKPLPKLNTHKLYSSHVIPKYHRNLATKKEFLRDTVLECLWSKEVLIKAFNNNPNYQQLLVGLPGAITIYSAAETK